MSLYGRFYRRSLNWHDMLLGRRTSSRLAEAERTQWLTADQLQQTQWAELRQLLEHAYQHVPWYRSMFERLGAKPSDIRSPADFRRLPVLTKKDIRQHLSELLTTKPSSPLYVQSTGGSTGTPLEFRIDRVSYEWRQALRRRTYGWASALDGEVIVYLWGAPITPLPWQRRLKTALHYAIERRHVFNTYDLDQADCSHIVEAINRLRPSVVVGYVSSLVTLGRFVQQHEVKLPPVRSVIATAESLFEPQRHLIQEAFGCPVFNSYGSREFTNIATECDRHEGLHLQSENLYVECLHEGQPAAAGSSGELVITDLHNYGMPFIRYAIGDTATMAAHPCSCGRGLPLLRNVDGRVFDTIRTPDGRIISGLFFTGLLLESFREIEQFQAVQTAVDELRLRIVVSPHHRPCAQRLADAIQSHIGPSMRVIPEFHDRIHWDQSGKHRITVNQCGRTEATTNRLAE